MQLYVLLVAILASASQVALASLPVDPTQLAAWRDFFTATNGASWTRCKGKLDSPCTCSGTVEAVVTCVAQNGVNFIQSVKLRNNNLAAPEFPSDIVNNLIGGFSAFTTMDLRDNPKLKNPSGNCLPIPNCSTTGVTCKLPYSLCTSTGSPTAPTVTVAPSSPPSNSPTTVSLPAWSSFFDATAGSTWSKCKNTKTTPCDCQRNQPTSSPVRVVCTGSNINRISLIANNLTATDFPSDEVTGLIQAGVTVINLTSNPSLAPDATCVNAPACLQAGITCTFDKPVCSDTPTTPPVTLPPSSAAPTTAAPTTAAPTTKAPTTAAPTSKAPTTASPSTSSTTASPSTSSTTASPSASSTTVAPSPESTDAPTASPIAAATDSPVSVSTDSPTPGIAPGVTSSPTQSAAVRVNSDIFSVAAGIIMVAMMM